MKGRNSISMTNTIARTMFTCILVNDKVFLRTNDNDKRLRESKCL
jgi:hypothetical protein